MKLKYILKKNLNIKNGYLIAIMITLILVVGGYFSYAVFTTTNESKGALNIITGNLYSYIDSTDLDVNKEITLAPKEVKFVTIKLTNINTIAAKANLYYSLSEPSDKLEIGYSTLGDAAPTSDGVVLGKSGSGNDSKTIEIRIVNDDTKNIKISFGSNAGLETKALDFPTGKSVLTPLDGNINLVRAYTYNQERDALGQPTENFCVTGEEPGCVINQCYSSEDISSCPVGTIIKYRVNSENSNDDIRYFHVMKDDGEHLTMQQRESTTEGIRWNTSRNHSDGPLAALELLDEKTREWKYVNDQTFKMGETVFKDNAFTGGNYSTTDTYEYNGYNFRTIPPITENTYVMEQMTRKARMITLQEAIAFGCKVPAGGYDSTPSTCPIWMYNYLGNCTRMGCTVDDDIAWEYWTMNAGQRTDGYTNIVWAINYYGHLNDETIYSPATVRAVVEVNKR